MEMANVATAAAQRGVLSTSAEKAKLEQEIESLRKELLKAAAAQKRAKASERGSGGGGDAQSAGVLLSGSPLTNHRWFPFFVVAAAPGSPNRSPNRASLDFAAGC
jgi:hypothetical protein